MKLDLSAYGEKYKYSANVGVLDMVMALQWIEHNIEAFCGDPNNITVFGQSGGGPVYAYLFTHQTPPMGAFHGAEIPFIFRQGNDGRINDLMSAVWVSFFRDGVPPAEGLPEWEHYERENAATMILDTESYLAHGHDRKLMELLAPGLRILIKVTSHDTLPGCVCRRHFGP